MPFVSGRVEAGFERVAEAFAENFARRGELGAACAVYLSGEKVVDLWGGVRDRRSGERWEADTMVCVFSGSKGMSALALALANSRRLFEYDDRVVEHWPEFGRHGKERTTVRQLLSHQAGLFALDARVDLTVLADPDRLAVILADQRPEWPPGERQAYAMISLGFYESELLRRVDPQHRTVGRYFRDEIAAPLGLDFHIGLPAGVPNSRLAVIQDWGPLTYLRAGLTAPRELVWAGLNPRSPLRRSDRNPSSNVVIDRERVYQREVEVPAGGGVGTARAIAKAYGEFASGGRTLDLRPATLEALMAPAVPPSRGFQDECLRTEWQLSLGFLKPSPGMFDFASPHAFGMPGWGGSLGFGDPDLELGYSYVLNRMGAPGVADQRERSVRAALRSALAALGAAPRPDARTRSIGGKA